MLSRRREKITGPIRVFRRQEGMNFALLETNGRGVQGQTSHTTLQIGWAAPAWRTILAELGRLLGVIGEDNARARPPDR